MSIHLVDGSESRRPCSGVLHIGTFSDGSVGAAHSLPYCSKFAELPCEVFVHWLLSANQVTHAETMRLERARAAGRVM